jgi:hypothetical protein
MSLDFSCRSEGLLDVRHGAACPQGCRHGSHAESPDLLSGMQPAANRSGRPVVCRALLLHKSQVRLAVCGRNTKTAIRSGFIFVSGGIQMAYV